MIFDNKEDDQRGREAFHTLAELCRDNQEFYLLISIIRTFKEVRAEYEEKDQKKISLIKGGNSMKKLIAAPPLNADITRIEYKGQLVLTTTQLAEFYECQPKNIRDNFNNNKEHFIKGKHFFKLKDDALKEFRIYTENIGIDIPAHTKHIYLWTKRGCARHAKMLNTDMAWNVYEMLEDVYFDVYNNPENPYVSVSSFDRADILCRLASHAPDPFTKKKLIDEATNLVSKKS